MVFVTAGATVFSLVVLLTMIKKRIGEFKGIYILGRGVASFTQIFTCVHEKLAGIVKDFLRTPSRIPL